MNKYEPLQKFLLSLPKHQTDITLSFEKVEKILGSKLPLSAYKHLAWWSNEVNGVHVSAHAWMDAGWKMDTVSQKELWVRFVRQTVLPKPVDPEFAQLKDIPVKTPRTTVYALNCPNKTLVIHKPGCRMIPRDKLQPCGCGDTGEYDNQRWFCETHITREAADEFMNGRFWAILMCDLCFRAEQEILQKKQGEPIGALADQFQKAMYGVADFASERKFGKRFRQMIDEHGGVEAAKSLLDTQEIQDGLMILWESKALNQSMEALVIQERFQPLFTIAEIAEARRRLEMLGFFK
jgi:hypothetical protein